MSNKHDANVRKSSLVNFQIGLIASLLFTYVMFEVYTAKPVVHKPSSFEEYDEEVNFSMDNFIIEPKPIVEVAARMEKPKNPDLTRIKEVPDETVLNKIEDNLTPEMPKLATISITDIEDIDPDDDDVPERMPFIAVENVPVFPGCEYLKTNKEKAACFNENVRKIISKKFNTDLGNRYGLQGTQRIYAQFDVAKDGSIQNLKIRAPHPQLQKEAERVIHLFPKMTPGMQRKVPVSVKYVLPIIFQVHD